MIKIILNIFSFLKKHFSFPREKEITNNKIFLVYDSDSPEGLEQLGTLYFNDIQCRFISGKYGRGFAPRGKWRAIDYHELDQSSPYWKGYSLFNMAFYVNLQLISLAQNASQLEKNRSIHMDGIQIHFDGGVRGTLGCFGLIPENEDHAIRIKNIFRNYFDNNSFIEVEVL